MGSGRDYLKTMKNYFKRLFAKDKKKFVFTTTNLGESTGNGMRISGRAQGTSSGFVSIESLYTEAVSTNTNNVHMFQSGKQVGSPKDYRKEVQPIEVFNEIKKEGLEPNFNDLDKKIETVTKRIEILREHLSEEHLMDEHKALFFLRNRRKYLETRKKYPLDWAMTNREAVDDLCKRYKLQVVPLKQYYTLVPNEGLKEMNRYTKAYEAITGDKPIFELVIKEKEVKKEEEKQRTRKDRDPILLANSPLGNFMFVLGAWDEEVEYVDEIIYEGK